MAQPVTHDVWESLADGDLVMRCLQGQREAFEPLFDRYARQVYTIAYRLSGNSAEAEDLTQETFLQAFRSLRTLQQPQAFAGWLYQIATNTGLDRLRRRKLSQAELTEAITETYPDESRWQSPQDAVLRKDERGAVWTALDCLAPSQRAALILREFHELPYAAIADALGISTGAVEVLIFRARRRFREYYEQVAAGAIRDRGEQKAWCQETPAVLATILDHEESGAGRVAALAHARVCPACQAEIAAQRAARRSRGAVALLPLPLGLKLHLLPHLLPTGGLSTGGASLGTAASSAGSAGPAAATSGGAAGSTTAASAAGSAGSSTAVAATTGSAATARAGPAAAGAGAATLGTKAVALVSTKVLLLVAGATTAAAVAVATHAPQPHSLATSAPLTRRQAPAYRPAAVAKLPQLQPPLQGRHTVAMGPRLQPSKTATIRSSRLSPHTGRAVVAQPRPHVRPVRLPPRGPVAQPRRAQQGHPTSTRTGLPARGSGARLTRSRHVQRRHATIIPHPHGQRRVAARSLSRQRQVAAHAVPARHTSVQRMPVHRTFVHRTFVHRTFVHRTFVHHASVHVTPRRHMTAVPRKGPSHPAQRRARAPHPHLRRHGVSHPHRRATPAHVQRPAPRQPGRHQPAEGSAGLQVIWPRVLRFDRKDVLRLTTLPNADVTVTLRVVPQENSSIQPAQSHALRRITLVYRFTAHAHADGHGHATVRLRYAYVPPRPEPATLGVVVRAGRRILQQNARVQLVRG